MRRQWQLAICLVLLGVCNCKDIPSVEEILRTNQYIIVAQQDRTVSFETDIAANKCPQALISPNGNNGDNSIVIGMHLVRDRQGLRPPKLMILQYTGTFLKVNIMSIDKKKVFEANPEKRFEEIKDMDRQLLSLKPQHIWLQHRKLTVQSGTVFDYRTNILYVYNMESLYFEMSQHYVDPFEDGRSVEVKMTRGKLQNERSEFVEDPYEHKVYYKETVNKVSAYYEAPIEQLEAVLVGNYSGKLVSRAINVGVLQSATGGAFFITNALSNSSFLIGTRSLGKGVNCAPNKTPPNFQKLLVVRNSDFCMIRDGDKYKNETCEKENHEFLVAKGTIKAEEEEDEVNFVVWLVVLCLFLILLNVLLFAYIYWLRTSFVTEEDRIRQEENDTEASLFVAKQRSFPASYQEPGLLDVSVDRWN